MTLENNRAPLLYYTKLCASFQIHRWIQTGVIVRKRLSWVVTSVTLTFDLWLWPFAWTLPWSLVITPENFMMIRWWEHSQKVWQTDRRTRRKENTIHCPACRTSLIATRFWVVVICPIIKCLTVLEFSFILFDLCLFITIFNCFF